MFSITSLTHWCIKFWNGIYKRPQIPKICCNSINIIWKCQSMPLPLMFRFLITFTRFTLYLERFSCSSSLVTVDDIKRGREILWGRRHTHASTHNTDRMLVVCRQSCASKWNKGVDNAKSKKTHSHSSERIDMTITIDSNTMWYIRCALCNIRTPNDLCHFFFIFSAWKSFGNWFWSTNIEIDTHKYLYATTWQKKTPHTVVNREVELFYTFNWWKFLSENLLLWDAAYHIEQRRLLKKKPCRWID